MIKKIRYLLEAAIVKLGILFFGSLSLRTASNVASGIAKFIGKRISVHQLAFNNLSKAMPELTKAQKEKILDDMWDNLGRIVGEFPHVTTMSGQELDEIVEAPVETLENIKNSKGGGIIISGHIGNWEIGPKFFIHHGINVSTVYRPLNNPYVEKMTAQMRRVEMIEKHTSHGNRRIIEVIKNGGFVIILADQKVTEGEPVKFFHDDAITTTSIARLALRYKVPIYPARSMRLGHKAKFGVSFEKPLPLPQTTNLNLATLELTRTINQKLEQWIKEYPSQWFWVHNRWKK